MTLAADMERVTGALRDGPRTMAEIVKVTGLPDSRVSCALVCLSGPGDPLVFMKLDENPGFYAIDPRRR